MTMHDNKIELPPNPITPMLADLIDKATVAGTAATIWQLMQEFAKQAVIADRQCRGEPVAWLVRDSMFAIWSVRWVEPEPGLWKYVKPLYAESSDSLPRHVAQTLATAIYETAQKMGIANGDHSTLSVPQCLHLLDCMSQLAEPEENDALTAADYEQVLADHRRLVRELDVLLNGEDGAAKQASLCDIIAQVRREGIKANPTHRGHETY